MKTKLRKTVGLGMILVALACGVTGCATVTKPVYPAAEAGGSASVLKLDNTMSDSMFAMELYAPVGLKITVDGFSPLEQGKLKSGHQLFQSKQFLPKGVTEVRLPAGSHTLTHTGQPLANTPLSFNPVTMSFDTEEGKTYVIRFKKASKAMKLKYSLEYEGWSTEQTSQWPNEVGTANSFFGR